MDSSASNMSGFPHVRIRVDPNFEPVEEDEIVKQDSFPKGKMHLEPLAHSQSVVQPADPAFTHLSVIAPRKLSGNG